MAKKPETLFKERVQRDIKKLKYCWGFKTQEVATHGIPDIVLGVNSWHVILELKTEGEEPKPLQQYHLDENKRCRNISFAPTPKTWPRVFNYLQELDEMGFRKPPLFK